MNKISEFAYPVGRVLLGLLFVVAGFGKVMGGAAIGGYIESKLPGMGFLAWPASLFELFAGLMLVVGFQTRWTALALAGFCVFTGLVFHGFGDMNGLLKNVALAGGYLLLVTHGAGKYALDKS